MEANLDRVELAPGPFRDLIDLVVKEATVSVEKHETRQPRIDGCLAGLERCADMRDLDVEDFELELMQMEQTTTALKQELYGDETTVKSDDYWRQRCATAQIEYCYEILRSAHLAEHGELPDDQRQNYSARSAVRYNVLAIKLDRPLLT